ncbi:helix-turn-helix domain-containing protein [Actinomadura macrotermitis]|uniref:Helix-turn-helix domain-containing protein n=1 Tax=Actinomadura macrotermitis TaxID=2585200 RepID=A0A7K0BTY3_9ACTN|nr:helix-turn-helix domain-containing protein [Actinomadura macrotermitis]MQY04154.1 hypothetical protein [Actinomadura macrotermitis]
MTTTIRTDTPGWTRIPHTLARDERLTNGARGLAVQMLSHADGFRSDEEFLAHHTADSRNAVRRQLAELRRYGYLVRERVRGTDGKVTTRSVLYDTPQTAPAGSEANGAPAVPPSRRTPARRSELGIFTGTGCEPLAASRRDGPTSSDTTNPQAAPFRHTSATRLDQPGRDDTAGRAVSPPPGAQSGNQGEEQKKIDRSAQHREAEKYLRSRYGATLTDRVIGDVLAVVHGRAERAGRPIANVVGYLAGMAEGHLADLVTAALAAEQRASDAAHDEHDEPGGDELVLDEQLWPPALRAEHRTVAEALAAAVPTDEPDALDDRRPPGRPPAAEDARTVSPSRTAAVRAMPAECPHGRPGGALSRPDDGEPACGPCRTHKAVCRRGPNACPTCRTLAAAAGHQDGLAIVRPA